MLGTAVLLGRCQLARPDTTMSADVQMRVPCSLCPRPPSRACNKTGGSEREAWYNLSREGRKEVERT